MPILRMYGFKLEGVNGLKRVFATFKPRMKLLREKIDKEINLPKHKAKTTVLEKQLVISQKQSVVYTSLQISKLNLKRLRIERMHTEVYTGSL